MELHLVMGKEVSFSRFAGVNSTRATVVRSQETLSYCREARLLLVSLKEASGKKADLGKLGE